MCSILLLKTKRNMGVQGYALATTNKPQGLSSVLDFACSVDTLTKLTSAEHTLSATRKSCKGQRNR